MIFEELEPSKKEKYITLFLSCLEHSPTAIKSELGGPDLATEVLKGAKILAEGILGNKEI
jgi:hypothetical protein